MAYGESNGHAIDDIMLHVVGERHCTRLAEVVVSDCFFQFY